MNQRTGGAAAVLALAATGLAAVLGGCQDTSVTTETRTEQAKKDLASFYEKSAAPMRPIGLGDAIRSSLDHNLEQALSELDTEIAQERLSGARRRMLPEMQFSGEASNKDKLTPSTSKDYFTGKVSEDPSYSSTRETRQWDLTVSWNMLDFGISYFAARQADHRVGIEEQRVRRMRQNLALKVTKAYWRAVIARDMYRDAVSLDRRMGERLVHVREQIRDGSLSSRAGLEQCRKLMTLQARLKGFGEEYRIARAELAELMGLPPSTEFELAGERLPALKNLSDVNVEVLEDRALRSRPELYEQDHQQAVQADEARIAMLKMAPSPDWFLRRSSDQNPLLYTSYWYTAGIKTAFDLLSVPAQMKQVKVAKREEDAVEQKRLMLAVGILTQVRVAMFEYRSSLESCTQSWEYLGVNNDLLKTTRAQMAEGKVHEGELLSMEAEYFFARLQYLRAYSTASFALGKIANAVGVDPLTETDALARLLAVGDSESEARVREAAFREATTAGSISVKTVPILDRSTPGTSLADGFLAMRGVPAGKLRFWQDFNIRPDETYQGWAVETWGNPARLYREPLGDSDSVLGLDLFEGRVPFVALTYTVPDTEGRVRDFSGVRAVRVDVFNGSRFVLPVSLGLSMYGNGAWEEYETEIRTFAPGWTRMAAFVISEPTLRSQHTGWKDFDSALQHADSCGKIRFFLYNYMKTANVRLDNLMLEMK